MVHDGLNWRMKKRRLALILSAALLPLLAFAASAVHAQSIMRTPNLNVGSRVPTINPTAPRTPTIAVRPNINGDAVSRTRMDLGARSTLSVARFPANSSSACRNAGRGSDGECLDTSTGGGDAGGGKGGSAKNVAKNVARKGKGGSDKGSSQAVVNPRTVPNELVAEIDG